MTKARARSTGDQHDPHAVHRRGPAGEVGPSRHADGAGAAGLYAVEPGHALRSEGSDLARSRPLRAVERPCLDAAVVGPASHRHPGGERRVRAPGQAVGHARRHPPFPPARQQGAGASGISLGVRRRDDDRSAGPGDRHQRRHGDRAQVAGQPLQPARLRDVRLQHLRRLRRRLPDGRRRLGGGLAGRPSRARRPLLDLRQQPHHHRRQHQHHLHRGCRGALPGLSAGTCCASAMPTISSGSRTRSRSSARPRAGRR